MPPAAPAPWIRDLGDGLVVRALSGGAAGEALEDVARLRQRVFRDFPYLYDGDPAYEARYLRAYAASPGSVFVLASAGGRIVGASTGLPLADDGEAFQAPLRAAGIDVASVFYFGESVLEREWRGRGIGHAFFDAREAHARALGGFATTAFCAVDRAPDDPRRPAGHRDNDAFWRKRGYVRRDDLRCVLDWRELGDAGETPHTLTFWTRALA